jgi:hypothetical protein
MDILAAILTCSLYADDALVLAIIDNAHDNPLSIITPERDPDTGSLSSAPQTLDAATAQLSEITAHGGRPLAGLMQVPVTWASTFGREPQELFDPCINISIGTAMLSEFDYACARASSTADPRSMSSFAVRTSRRECLVRQFARAIHMPELMTVVSLELRSPRAPLPSPNDAPIHAPAIENRSWGADRMFAIARSRDMLRPSAAHEPSR